MVTQTTTLAIPLFRRYEDGKRVFYLSTGLVTEDGEPVICNRWNADRVLNKIVSQYGRQSGTVTLPKLRDYWTAVEHRPRARKSIFSDYKEHLLHLILPAGAKTETGAHVLKNEDGRTLRSVNRARLLNPIETVRDGRKKIVRATVFDLPFQLKYGRYDPEMLDEESGFLKEAPKSEGSYIIQFEEQNRLYASFLDWGGDVDCNWEPSSSYANVGFRGASTGNLPEKLIEK